MTIEIALLVSIVSVSFAIYFGLRNNKRADVKELEERVKQNTETKMTLEQICRNVADIKESILETKKDVQKLTGDMAILNQKVDKAHLRIDILEGKDITTES